MKRKMVSGIMLTLLLMGTLTLAFNVQPANTESTTIEEIIIIPIRHGVEISIDPVSALVKPGNSALYNVTVKNTGNVDDVFWLLFNCYEIAGKVIDKEIPFGWLEGWYSCVAFDNMTICLPPSVSLKPDESKNKTLTINVPDNWAGMDDITYPFTVTAQTPWSPGVSDTAEANLTVEATKRSMAEFVKYELQWLKSAVEELDIVLGIRRSLLSQIDSAILTEQQALNYIIAENEALANNMLTSCKRIINAFIYETQALNGRPLAESDADSLIQLAQEIIKDIEKTMAEPIE